MTHETDEDLSALMDGELPADAAARVRAHASSCAECAGRLDRLGAASSAFRRSGEHPVPAGLAERAKAAAQPRRIKAVKVVKVAFGVVLVAGMVLIGGVTVKKLMPILFNNVQQMITGAASQMGSGGR